MAQPQLSAFNRRSRCDWGLGLGWTFDSDIRRSAEIVITVGRVAQYASGLTVISYSYDSFALIGRSKHSDSLDRQSLHGTPQNT